MSRAPKTVETEQALDFYKQGMSQRAAAEAAGIAHQTLRRHLAALGAASITAKENQGEALTELVAAGVDAMRLEVWAAVAKRVVKQVPDESIPFRDLRDGLVAYGIADDKLEHRGMGGSVSVQNVNQVVVKTEWPEP